MLTGQQQFSNSQQKSTFHSVKGNYIMGDKRERSQKTICNCNFESGSTINRNTTVQNKTWLRGK